MEQNNGILAKEIEQKDGEVFKVKVKIMSQAKSLFP
jgi:hypothetical protein